MRISNLEKELDFYIGFPYVVFFSFCMTLFVVLSTILPKIQGLVEFEFPHIYLLASVLSENFDDRV